jgi:dihydroorotate dehydrogenase (fumarate)
MNMVDLTTSYLGLQLKNPVVASSSPLSQKVETTLKLQDAGVSAIVMYSLFEEQIMRESLIHHEDLMRGTDSFAEALDYLPDFGQYTIGPDTYIDHLSNIKKALEIPVIGSLNGVSNTGWIEYAQKIEDAGADGLELNIYYLPTDINLTSSELEEQYLRLAGGVRDKVKIPLAVKLSPFITALPNFAKRLQETGINGLILFNRFYQPDFDLEELEVVPNLILSDSDEMRLPLRWIAILYGRIQLDFALTSGVHTAQDVLKAVMAGASVTTIASEFLQNGIESAAHIISEMKGWMVEHEYDSINQMKGSMSQGAVAVPQKFERANYMKVLSSY